MTEQQPPARRSETTASRGASGRRTAAGGNPKAIRASALGKSGVERTAPAGSRVESPALQVNGAGTPAGSSGNGHARPSVLELPVTRTSGDPQRPVDVQDLAVPATKEAENGQGRDRRTIVWTRALLIGVICFAVWLLLDAPTLMKNAEGSPLGTRRTISMDFLRPIAWLSRETGLSHVVGAADRILGRDGSGAVAISSGPVVKIPPTTLPPPTTIVTTKTGKTVVKPILLPDGLPPFPPISAHAPLRVLDIGDSVGEDLGEFGLVDDLGSTGVVSATLDGQIDTGLTRPDYFNWPAQLRNDISRLHPQLVVICIGANDAQSTIVNGHVYVYGTSAWDNLYRSRISAFISEATSTGAHVLWVGMPPMASPQLNGQMAHLNNLYQQVISHHIGATFMSSVPVLGGRNGVYTAFKNSQEIRTDDGIHLQPAGAQLLAQAVIAEIDQVYRLHLHP